MENHLPELTGPSDNALLAACRDCLSDLAALRDRRLVITAIVRRARALLGTDMAYFSSNDLAAGETFIQYTDGVRTDEYAAIRMPFGAGVLGAAAAGGKLVYTYNYLTDEQLNHLPEIDAIVAAEGVASIIGAPMREGGRVAGALMAAHRQSVRFGPKAIQALETLAQYAAIAVEQTRLWDEIAKLDRQAEIQSLTEQLRLDDRLLAALLAEDGLTSVIAALSEATGAVISICDTSGRLLAGAELPAKLKLAVTESAATAPSLAASARHYVAGQEVALATIMARQEQLGVMVMRAAEIHDGELAVLGRAADYASVLLLFERNLAEAGLREHSILFEDLLTGRPDSAPASRLAEFGLTVTTDCQVAVFRVAPRNHYKALGLIRRAHPSQALIAQRGGEICVLGVGDPKYTHASLSRADIAAQVGVARLRDDWSDVPRAYKQARQIAASLQSLGRSDSVARLGDLGVAGLLVAGVDQQLVSLIVDGQIGALINYDRERKTDLCATALTQLESSSLAECARRLHVHVNTVRQRLERIDALLGPWREGSKRADVHFALLLHRLRRSPDGAD